MANEKVKNMAIFMLLLLCLSCFFLSYFNYVALFVSTFGFIGREKPH